MEVYNATSEAPFLKSLFYNLNKLQQNYCVMRNHLGLPYDLKGSDLDILIPKKSLDFATELIVHSAQTQGGFVVWREWNDCLRIILCFGIARNGIRWGVHIDLFTDIRWKGLNYYPSGDVLKDSIIQNGIRVSNPFHANLVALLNKFLYLGTSPKADNISAVVSQPEYTSILRKLLISYFGNKVELIISILRPANSRKIKSLARQLRRGLVLRSILKFPLASLRNKGLRLVAHWHRLRHRSGLFVAVFGTDGSGKTTLIDTLRPIIERFLHCETSVFHWRPSLFPALRTLTGKDAETLGPINRPHTKAASGFFGSFFRLAYYCLDHVLGFWFKVYPKIVRLPTVVFFDRYFHDNYFDSARFRIYLPHWVISVFNLIIPKPDLAIFLKVPPEVANTRKPELSIAEHRRQQEQMHHLTAKFRHFEFVSTDGPIEKSQNEILDAIIRHFKVLKGWN